MDIKEFEEKMQPKAKRSRLEPFHAQIFELKEKGYANWQICVYLADKGITISQEGVRKFIKSREGRPISAIAGSGTEPAPSAQGNNEVPKTQELGEVLDAKKQEEKTTQYIKQNANSLANRNKNQG